MASAKRERQRARKIAGGTERIAASGATGVPSAAATCEVGGSSTSREAPLYDRTAVEGMEKWDKPHGDWWRLYGQTYKVAWMEDDDA